MWHIVLDHIVIVFLAKWMEDQRNFSQNQEIFFLLWYMVLLWYMGAGYITDDITKIINTIDLTFFILAEE